MDAWAALISARSQPSQHISFSKSSLGQPGFGWQPPASLCSCGHLAPQCPQCPWQGPPAAGATSGGCEARCSGGPGVAGVVARPDELGHTGGRQSCGRGRNRCKGPGGQLLDLPVTQLPSYSDWPVCVCHEAALAAGDFVPMPRATEAPTEAPLRTLAFWAPQSQGDRCAEAATGAERGDAGKRLHSDCIEYQLTRSDLLNRGRLSSRGSGLARRGCLDS